MCTLLALGLNPAYLLLELSTKPQDQDGPLHFCEACCPRFWKRARAAQAWVLYLLAPHHYVTLCVRRAVHTTSCGGCKARLLTAVAGFNVFADCCGVYALVALVGLEPVRKTPFLSHFYTKTIMLPRQARDKHVATPVIRKR